MQSISSKPSKSSLSVAIRFRPLFEGEAKAAQWKVSVLKSKEKDGGKSQSQQQTPEEVHQVKLMDKLLGPGVNTQGGNQGSADPFLKLLGGANSSPQKTHSKGSDGANQIFQFDKVFTQDHYNCDIYQQQCSPIVKSCLDGYNGTIFAYGQTSSGKTHTMLGTTFDRGILLQTAKELFDFASDNQDVRDVTLWASYLEIYNEQINDLLDVNNTNLKLREDPGEGYYVSGLKSVKLHQAEDFKKLLTLGEKARRYRATDMNEHSSRSHTIFRILIENRLCESKKVVLEAKYKKKEQDGDEEAESAADLFNDEIAQKHLSYGTKYSVLNLVDLAGSERLAQSGHGSVEETSHINKSLFVLANVIYKLSENKKGNQNHIPYRESKLTQILRTALGGNSLTAVICTVSPNFEHVNLTLSTLRFGQRAKAVETVASANEVVEDHLMLQEYKKQVTKLEKRIAQLEDLLTTQEGVMKLQLQEIENLKGERDQRDRQDSDKKQASDSASEALAQLSKIFDIKSLLKMTEEKNRAQDMEFELDQLRVDNVNLKNDADREQKTGSLFRQLYNRQKAAQAETRCEAETQTAPIDNYFLFSSIIKLILGEHPHLKEHVLTQNKYMDLFWKFFEFQDLLAKEIAQVPKLRSFEEKDGKEAAPEGLKKLAKIDFYKRNQVRPRSTERQPGGSGQSSELVARTDLDPSVTEDLDRASEQDLSQYVESESVDISAPYRDTGIRGGLEVEVVRGAQVAVTSAEKEGPGPPSMNEFVRPRESRLNHHTPSREKREQILKDGLMIAKLQKSAFEETVPLASPQEKQMKTPVMIQRKISASKGESTAHLAIARRSQSSVVEKSQPVYAASQRETEQAVNLGTPLQSKFSSKRNLPRSQVRVSQNAGAVAQGNIEEIRAPQPASKNPIHLNQTLTSNLGRQKPIEQDTMNFNFETNTRQAGPQTQNVLKEQYSTQQPTVTQVPLIKGAFNKMSQYVKEELMNQKPVQERPAIKISTQKTLKVKMASLKLSGPIKENQLQPATEDGNLDQRQFWKEAQASKGAQKDEVMGQLKMQEVNNLLEDSDDNPLVDVEVNAPPCVRSAKKQKSGGFIAKAPKLTGTSKRNKDIIEDLEGLFDADELEEIRKEGYKSEDEIEEFLSQEIIDTTKDLKFNNVEAEVKRKFNLHKQIQSLLQEDLSNLVPVGARRKPGINTFMFGQNRHGLCGQGNDEPFVYSPEYLNGGKFKALECGLFHSIGVDNNRMMYSWGRNRFGQLGQGVIGEDDESIDQTRPTPVKGILHRVKVASVACGWQHSMALTPNGFVFAWGLNVFGQLGLGDFVDRAEPQQLKSLSEYCVKSLSAGHLHSAALTDQGKLFTWGHNPDCRLVQKLQYYQRSGRTKNFATPQYCKSIEHKFLVQVSCATTHTLMLDTMGFVYAAGCSDNGQLGVIPYQFVPKICDVPFIGVPGIYAPAKKIQAGDGFTLVLSEAGHVYSCGKGNFGRLGHGTDLSLNTLTRIQWFTKQGLQIRDIFAGGRHSLAISYPFSEEDEISHVYGWGFGFYYQLGQGQEDNEDYFEPLRIDLGKKARNREIKLISCGYFNSAAIVK